MADSKEQPVQMGLSSICPVWVAQLGEMPTLEKDTNAIQDGLKHFPDDVKMGAFGRLMMLRSLHVPLNVQGQFAAILGAVAHWLSVDGGKSSAAVSRSALNKILKQYCTDLGLRLRITNVWTLCDKHNSKVEAVAKFNAESANDGDDESESDNKAGT